MPSHMEPLNPDRPRYQHTPQARRHLHIYQDPQPTTRPAQQSTDQPRDPAEPLIITIGLTGAFLLGATAHLLLMAPFEWFIIGSCGLTILQLLALVYISRSHGRKER